MRMFPSKVCDFVRGRSLAVAVLGVAVFAPSALAGGGPPDMAAVEWPVDPASIGTAIVAAGGTILLIVFGSAIGFALAKKLFHRVKSAV